MRAIREAAYGGAPLGPLLLTVALAGIYLALGVVVLRRVLDYRAQARNPRSRMTSLRVFFVGGLISYRALFGWMTPSIFFLMLGKGDDSKTLGADSAGVRCRGRDGSCRVASYLDSACKGDLELRREVESLLHARQSSSGILERPADANAGHSAMAPGSHIHHYEIVSLLGQGGMGQVFLARDTRLGRAVALKLLPRTTDLGSRLLRFEQEARSASALSHPNVCVIYEINHTESGDHYIAMEACRRSQSARAPRARPDPFRRGSRHRASDRFRAGRGPQGGNRAPRHQAGKHHAAR